MKCRSCGAPLARVFIDLGTAPPSNAFLRAADLELPETWFPLKLYACDACRLVQVDEHQDHREIFSGDYVYFSSYSSSWLAHARRYVDAAVARLALGPGATVMEVASNDGYLLQFVRERGIACVGVEPTASTAAAARARGIETVERFFGLEFADEWVASRGTVDLAIANNVLAHVPDVNDFVRGFARVLAPAGVVTFEFPHLLELVRQCQFDTIYHEHFSYLSLHTVRSILAAHGLEVFDAESLPTHGGSLRVWAQRRGGPRASAQRLADALRREADAGMLADAFYDGFQARADRAANDFLAFLLEQRRAGRRVAAYGAAAKGNTLLNYAGVRPDLLPYVVDASPHKQGRWLPGSRIPVVDESRLRATRPDFVVILPWNLREEICAQLAYVREWGARFVTAIPALEIFGEAAA